MHLSADRSIGFAMGPIPFTAIDCYAERYGIEGIDAFERFHALIRAMDTAYLGFKR